MKIYLITFAEGEIYEKSQNNLDKTLKISDIDEHILWNMKKQKKQNFIMKIKIC